MHIMKFRLNYVHQIANNYMLVVSIEKDPWYKINCITKILHIAIAAASQSCDFYNKRPSLEVETLIIKSRSLPLDTVTNYNKVLFSKLESGNCKQSLDISVLIKGTLCHNSQSRARIYGIDGNS
jgi:hypothetical protein